MPFAAGGPTDVLSRVLGERIRAALGQPVLIENVTGAGGSIGVGRVVSAPPDGYTISIGHFGTHVANGAIYPLKYDLLKDLDPVARLPSNPMILVTRKNFPGRQSQGADRPAQGESRQDRRGHGGRGLGLPHREPAAAEPDRRSAVVRAVSRHRPGACRTWSPARST